MSNKRLVIAAVQNLPEDATLDEISDEIALLAAIRRGETAAAAGRVLSHEEVRKLFTAMISPGPLPRR